MPNSKETDANASESDTSEKPVSPLALTLTVEEAAKLSSEDPLADKVWRLAASGTSMRAIGRMFGKSHTWAWAIVTERTKELQDISSVEHKAANRAIVLDRYDWAADTCRKFIENYDPEQDKGMSIPALLAVYVKCAENRAKVTGVCGEMDVAAVVDVNRLSEVARRIMLAGPHSKAGKMASRQAMDLAGVKEADVREVTPSPES